MKRDRLKVDISNVAEKVDISSVAEKDDISIVAEKDVISSVAETLTDQFTGLDNSFDLNSK